MKDYCKTCNQLLDVSLLMKDASKEKGYRNKCKKCLAESKGTKDYRPYNRKDEPYWLATKRALDKLRDVPCADCAGRFPSVCMDFDHVRGKKEFGIMAKYRCYSIEKILAETLKCEVVCANCHRIRTRDRR